MRLRQNGHHFPDNIFKCIFLKESSWISIRISLKFVPKVPIDNKPALVQIMSWRRPGDKPLSEPMMVNLLTLHQWVKPISPYIRLLKDNTSLKSHSIPTRPHLSITEAVFNMKKNLHEFPSSALIWNVSPGHQQPWYWLCTIIGSLSYTRKDLKYLCHLTPRGQSSVVGGLKWWLSRGCKRPFHREAQIWVKQYLA